MRCMSNKYSEYYWSLVINGVLFMDVEKMWFDCVRRASQFSLETNMCIFMCVCLFFFLFVGMIAKFPCVHKWNWSAKNGDMIVCKICSKKTQYLYLVYLYDKWMCRQFVRLVFMDHDGYTMHKSWLIQLFVVVFFFHLSLLKTAINVCKSCAKW